MGISDAPNSHSHQAGDVGEEVLNRQLVHHLDVVKEGRIVGRPVAGELEVTIVLAVKTTSSAVSGSPSDQVRPSLNADFDGNEITLFRTVAGRPSARPGTKSKR